MSNFYISDLENDVIKNQYFRHVIYTEKLGKSKKGMQLVLYKLDRKQSIEAEEHKTETQIFYIIQGSGTLVIQKNKKDDPEIFELNQGVIAIVPKKTTHTVTNTGKIPLKFFSIYNPFHFEDGRIDFEP